MTARQTRKDHARTKADTADPASETLDADYRAFHKTAKRLPERKRQAIEAKFQAAFARERQEGLRCLNSRFMFWSVCPEKACKRTSRCMGEPDACFERWWPAIPEGVKVQFRAFITASAKGLSNEEAVRESEAAVERAAEHIARVEAQQRAELASRAAAEPPLPRGRGPRVSVL